MPPRVVQARRLDQMEDDQNAGQPIWNTTKMKDDQNERRPKWKTTKMKDDQNGR